MLILILATLFSSCLCSGELAQKIDELKVNPYGFVFIDLGISEEELSYFSSIDIQRERFYHQFGELDKTEEKISAFLSELGENDPRMVSQMAQLLTRITRDVMYASGKETAWVHLRCSIPTDRYDIPRWHMDGYYYIPEGEGDCPLKFSTTLVGAPTLFYFLPSELRKTAKMRQRDRNFMNEFCKPENIASARPGKGSLFIGGQGPGIAALHSEPPIRDKRIFFSIVPSTQTQMKELKKRVLDVYPKDLPSITWPSK